ncbi:hypothetical protein [Herpetosiphon giganteus]|uniref:hypothetical protein n=1 Tax=Herpetosiphon giganteus TaxID=2029754 RepID=UPI001957398D|nr:hypothetical protein [Herpetosiphon giganteus]MBM7844674.1 hypothetical protein [Herpetosiphon giganteus]
MQRWLAQVLILIVVVAIGVGALIWINNEQNCQKVSLLFIGNSHTYGHDMPNLLAELAAAGEPRYCLEIKTVVEGGASLAKHWNDGAALQALQSQPWQYVVLQERSLGPIEDPQGFQQATSRWLQAIRQQRATPVLFVTWAREYAPEQQPQLNAAYAQAAGQQAILVKVGAAWQHVRQHDRSIALYEPDQNHATLNGAYLTACIFYTTLFRSPSQNLPNLTDLPDAQAQYLQQVAWQLAQN